MFDISSNELVEIGMLATILCLAVVLLVRYFRTPCDKRSSDDDSSYFVG